MVSLGQYMRGLRRLTFAWVCGDKVAALRERRLMAFRLLQGEAEQLTFTRAGTKWTVDVEGGVVPKKLFIRANAFEELRLALTAWLKDNGYINATRNTIVDIGANIGTPSVQLALETGLNILAIEPIPANYDLLVRNIAQNGLDKQVQCVRAAVSMRPGTLKMAVPKERATCEVIEDGMQPGFGKLSPDIPIIEVPSQRLETILNNFGVSSERIAVVWCDAQGLEREIIESAPGLWKAGAPMYLELWPKGINAHGGTDAFLTTIGTHFKAFVMISDMIKLGPQAKPRPLSELRKIVDSIGDSHDDALLI